MSLQLFLSFVRTETVDVNTSAKWCREASCAPALTDISWRQMTNPATPTVRETHESTCFGFRLILRFYLTKSIWPPNITWTLAATFKCGAIVTGNTRTVFRYERNNTMLANKENLNETDHNINSTNQDYAMDNSTATAKILPENRILEQIINSQMASMTRIVNGEDCPPGECPWQVETLCFSE